MQQRAPRDINPKAKLRAPIAFSERRTDSLNVTLYTPRLLSRYAKERDLVGYLDPMVLGHITLDAEDEGVRQVGFVSALSGYGPAMYEIALELARREDWRLAPGEEVSTDAAEVWRRFAERSDVDMEELPVELRIHKVDYLDASAVLRAPLRGFDAALRRGDAFVEKLKQQTDLSRTKIIDAIDEAGWNLYERMQTVEDRRRNRLKSRLL